ncbi:MAG: TIGR01777 family oxidoreductase [Bacteroidota bacterium]
MKKIIIFGGSGFIGRHLIEQLQDDYDVIVITRRPKTMANELSNKVRIERLRSRDVTKLSALFEDAKAVINLAGENVGERWNKKKMSKIKKSRLDVDNIIIRTARGTKNIPEVFIQGSSIGIYGLSRTSIDVTEETPKGQRGFLPKVAASHEETFEQLEKLTRVVYIRTGFVMDANEGALSKMAAPFKIFLGGKFGNGKQWNSWIHIDDEVNAIKFLIENNNSKGAYNLCAPNPVRQKELSTKLGSSLNRPSFVTKPSFVLRMALGAMADELLLNGLKILPKRLTDEGFKFKYNTIDEAFADIYGKS